MLTKKSRETSICYFFMVLLMISCMVNILRSSATSVEIDGNLQLSCNGSVGECMGGGSAGSFADAEEYLMESDVSSRILAGSAGRNIHNTLNKLPFCDAHIYQNCIKQVNKKTRPCTKYERCQRSIS